MKNKKGYILVWLIIAMFAMVGCSHIPFELKSKAEKEIAQMKFQHQEDTKAAVQKISEQKDFVIQAQELQLQAAANSLYGANYGYRFYQSPSRLDMIINNRVLEAFAAVKTPPTYEAIAKENERMAVELDETKTTLADLKKSHDIVVAANTEIANDKDKQVAIVKQMEKDMIKKEAEYNKALGLKQNELDAVNNKIIAMEKEKADSQASTERLKRELMIACGIGALLCLAGAIYSPIGKQGFAIGGVVLGGATVAIPYIEGWMIAVAILVVALIGAAIAAVKFNLLNKANTNMVHAIQDDIEQGSTTIKNGDGTVTEVPDAGVEGVIKSKLMEVGRLPTDINPVKISSPTP
jgi:hypothetical protein